MSSYDTDSDMAGRVQFHDKATCISYIANNFWKSIQHFSFYQWINSRENWDLKSWNDN